MSEIAILIISSSISTLLILATISYLAIFQKRGSVELKQHLISMDLYNRQANKRSEAANRRQEMWFRELGYSTTRILEIVDEPDED